MAFLDFLGKDVGGYANAVNDPGGLGVHPGVGTTGITYGDIANMLMNQSKSQTTRGFGNLIGQQFGNTAMQASANQAQGIQPLLYQQKAQQSKTSLADAFKVFATAYGITL